MPTAQATAMTRTSVEILNERGAQALAQLAPGDQAGECPPAPAHAGAPDRLAEDLGQAPALEREVLDRAGSPRGVQDAVGIGAVV